MESGSGPNSLELCQWDLCSSLVGAVAVTRWESNPCDGKECLLALLSAETKILMHSQLNCKLV